MWLYSNQIKSVHIDVLAMRSKNYYIVGRLSHNMYKEQIYLIVRFCRKCLRTGRCSFHYFDILLPSQHFLKWRYTTVQKMSFTTRWCQWVQQQALTTFRSFSLKALFSKVMISLTLGDHSKFNNNISSYTMLQHTTLQRNNTKCLEKLVWDHIRQEKTVWLQNFHPFTMCTENLLLVYLMLLQSWTMNCS